MDAPEDPAITPGVTGKTFPKVDMTGITYALTDRALVDRDGRLKNMENFDKDFRESSRHNRRIKNAHKKRS